MNATTGQKAKVGTAGWSYPHWNGLIYPKTYSKNGRPNHFHPLEMIAGQFDMVEINSTFYQPLKAEIAQLWLKQVSTNPNFQFTAKLHQQFTHKRSLDPSQVDEFSSGLRPLLRSGRLGALLLQFPWSFRFTEENRDFLIRLRRAFHHFPLVAEMRHDSWLAEEALGTFLDYRIGFCNIDQPEYTRAMPPTAMLTSGVGYVRLHGRNPQNSLGAYQRGASRKHQHDYLYVGEQLDEWLTRIDQVSRFSDRTFVVFNNDVAGQSYVNALQLNEMLGRHSVSAPLQLRRKYPEQLGHFTSEPRPQTAFEQQPLFQAA